MQPLVSIVVPIYNVERYLRQCVDSLLAQSLQNIELILVDDGSPDSCPAIVDEYAAKDSRVVAIHQPNGGYGNAMNHGIARARGEYIGIIESDDWAEPRMFEQMLAKARQTDAEMVKCGHYVYDSTQEPDKQNIPFLSSKINIYEAPDEAFSPLDWPPIFLFHTGPWSWLYRADVLRRVPFIETQGAAYQDIPFIFEQLSSVSRISVVKKMLVHYRVEVGSGSSSMVKDAKIMRMVKMTQQALEILQTRNIFNAVKEEFFYHAFGTYVPLIENIEKKYKQEFFDKAHALFALLKEDESFTFKYFRKKQIKQAKVLINGGKVSSLFRKWRFSYKKGRFLIRLAGYDICK